MSEDNSVQNQTHYKIVITQIQKGHDKIANTIAITYALDVNRIKILLKNLPYEIPQTFDSLKATKLKTDELTKLGCDTKLVKVSDSSLFEEPVAKVPKSTKHIKKEKGTKENSPGAKKKALFQKILIAGLVLLIPLLWQLNTLFSSSDNKSEIDEKSKNKQLVKTSESSKAKGGEKLVNVSKSSDSRTKSHASQAQESTTINEKQISSQDGSHKSGNNSQKDSNYKSNQHSGIYEESSDYKDIKEPEPLDKQSILNLDEISEMLTPMQQEVLNNLDLNQPLKEIMDEIDNSPLSRSERIEIASIYQESIDDNIRKTVAMLEVSIAFNKHKKKTWKKLIEAYDNLGETNKSRLARKEVQNIFPNQEDSERDSRSSTRDGNASYSYPLNEE